MNLCSLVTEKGQGRKVRIGLVGCYDFTCHDSTWHIREETNVDFTIRKHVAEKFTMLKFELTDVLLECLELKRTPFKWKWDE